MSKIIDVLLAFIALIIIVVVGVLYFVKKIGVLEMSMIEIAGIIAALTVIGAFLYRIYKAVSSIVKSVNEVSKRILELEQTCLRLEYLSLRNHNPENKIAIDEIYNEYHKRGGNSYITADYNEYVNLFIDGRHWKRKAKMANS